MEISKFVVNLFKNALKDNSTDNLVLGPASIYSCLLMVLAAADKETRSELITGMGITADSDDDVKIAKMARKLFLEDFNLAKENGPDLQSANQVLVSKTYPIKTSYIEHLKNCYHAEAKNVDFKNDKQKIVAEANDFVKDVTRGKIPDILNEDSLDDMTTMILINAMYFKGTWVDEFPKDATVNSDFYLSETNSIKVHFMVDLFPRDIPYAVYDDFEVANLNFKGCEMRMAIILPNAKDGLSALMSSVLDPSKPHFRNVLQSNKQGGKLTMRMPKFEMTSSIELGQTLERMGISKAFSHEADFSRAGANLSISRVIHKAYLKVNEEGAEAAAATACTLDVCARPPAHFFNADHPFMIMILNKNDIPLFIGKITNPSAKQ